MKGFYLTLVFITLYSGVCAEVVDVSGHRYPKELQTHGSTWELRGTDHFRYKRLFSVFTAAFYQQQKGQGRRLQFTYTRELKAEDLREQALKTLREQHDEQTLRDYKELTEQIQAAYVDVKEGDAYAITVHPETGTWLHLNGKKIFHTENASFGQWYLGIWLGPEPINLSLKEALTDNR